MRPDYFVVYLPGRWLIPPWRQGAAAAGLVPALAGALPRWFAATRHSAFLYVASELVKVFGDQASLAPQLGAPPGPPNFHNLPAMGRSAPSPIGPSRVLCNQARIKGRTDMLV